MLDMILFILFRVCLVGIDIFSFIFNNNFVFVVFDTFYIFYLVIAHGFYDFWFTELELFRVMRKKSVELAPDVTLKLSWITNIDSKYCEKTFAQHIYDGCECGWKPVFYFLIFKKGKKCTNIELTDAIHPRDIIPAALELFKTNEEIQHFLKPPTTNCDIFCNAQKH